MKSFCYFLWLVSAWAAPSDKYAYPTQKISLHGVTDLQIVGVNGKLKMRGRGRSASLNLQVQHSKGERFADWHLEVERRGHTLYFEVFNTAFGKQWNKQIRKELWPEFDVEIDSPSLPAVVGWREGAIQIANWNAKLEVSFIKGDARVLGGDHAMILLPVEGNIEVGKHSGPLSIRGESGKVSLHSNQGDLDLNWISGAVELQNCSGKIQIEAQNSQLKINGGNGQLSVKMGEGEAIIQNFAGQIVGQGKSAAWSVLAAAPSNLNVTTSGGAVGVGWEGGGRVFLTSNQGPIEIQHSDFLSVIEKDGRRVAEGVRTMKSMGQVFVRTDSGAIRWRQ